MAQRLWLAIQLAEKLLPLVTAAGTDWQWPEPQLDMLLKYVLVTAAKPADL
jgi:hypothetical protein